MLAVILGLTACGTESAKPDTQDEELAIEGTIENGFWVIENEQLPSADFRQKYERMEFTLDQNSNYTWKWVGKGGQTTYTFKGDAYYSSTAAKHSSGSTIWNIAIYVATINDMQLPGGFYGIFTYDDENHLIINVEPDVASWGVHPSAEGGIGSGESGDESVYRFTKQ